MVPASSREFRVEPNPADADLVAAAAAALGATGSPADAAVLGGLRPYLASTELGARGREWQVSFWVLPGAARELPVAAGRPAPRPRRVALCMHGHGHSCCLAAWARFWPPLHAAGFDIIALDAPGFGRSSGPAGQARLWNTDDAALVCRLLRACGVRDGDESVTAFAQCMGGAMFLRALAASPGLFAHNHVMHNCTIGNFPSAVVPTLERKRGKLAAYHCVDPDHMREAVAYKALSKLAADRPELCKYVDNERAIATGQADVLRAVGITISADGGRKTLARDPSGSSCIFEPSPAVLASLVKHVASEAPHARAGAAGVLELPARSAVELGRANGGFRVAVRLRPLLPREEAAAAVAGGGSGGGSGGNAGHAAAARRCYRLREVEVEQKRNGKGKGCKGEGEGEGEGKVAHAITVQTAAGGRKLQPHEFVFDRVFPEGAAQREVYEQEVAPLIEEARRTGCNATVFAYGQTGAGKTYTVDGAGSRSGSDGEGIVPRLLEDLFVGGKGGSSGAVEMSLCQLYDDKLTDLLGKEPGRPVAVRPVVASSASAAAVSAGGGSSAEHAQAVEFADATVVTATSAAPLLAAFRAGSARRATGATQMNDASSRSHALLTLSLPGSGKGGKGKGKGDKGTVITVVDLAGSERVKRSGAAATALAEAITINTSLLHLGRVVAALVSRDAAATSDGSAVAAAPGGHIPYRGSPLTRLLAQAVGGAGCRTLLLACCSPARDSADETLSTLRFARNATHVRNKGLEEAGEDEDGDGPEESQDTAAWKAKLAAAGAAAAGGFGLDRRMVVPGLRATGTGTGTAMEVYGDLRAGPAAPCVLLLHYFGPGSSGGADYVCWFDQLHAAGYRCLAPSFSGHGRSPGPAPPAKPDAAVLAGEPCSTVLRLLDHFGIDRAVVYGYDWGGGIGYEFGLAHPKRCSAVVGHNAAYRDVPRLSELQRRCKRQRK